MKDPLEQVIDQTLAESFERIHPNLATTIRQLVSMGESAERILSVIRAKAGPRSTLPDWAESFLNIITKPIIIGGEEA